jgi:hypothetical protein
MTTSGASSCRDVTGGQRPDEHVHVAQPHPHASSIGGDDMSSMSSLAKRTISVGSRPSRCRSRTSDFARISIERLELGGQQLIGTSTRAREGDQREGEASSPSRIVVVSCRSTSAANVTMVARSNPWSRRFRRALSARPRMYNACSRGMTTTLPTKEDTARDGDASPRSCNVDAVSVYVVLTCFSDSRRARAREHGSITRS